MQTIIHKASDRGHANHGWLNAHHSFSFAGYYDPKKEQFGTLRVLNDDIVQAGYGFGMHPHNNIEIVNSDPRRGYGHEKVLTAIKIDDTTLAMLQEKNFTLESVIPKGEELHLKRTANLSTISTSISPTRHSARR